MLNIGLSFHSEYFISIRTDGLFKFSDLDFSIILEALWVFIFEM